MRLLPMLVALLAAALLAPAGASAYVIQERGGLLSAANGIVLGPDGNFWIAEGFNNSVARMKPDGQIIGRLAVGAGPTSLAVGPGGRVWVAVSGGDKLVWIDATSPSPSTHDVSTAGQSNCGPVGVTAGAGKIFFTAPNDGICSDMSGIGSVNDDGTGTPVIDKPNPKAFDLEFSGGKLFVPGFDDGAIYRLDPATFNIESDTAVPGGGNPDGIAIDGAGTVWTTLFTAGKVTRHPTSQTDGNATVLTPSGGTLVNPFGIVAGADGRIYVTGQESNNLARINPADNSFTFYGAPPGGKPWQIVNGPDGDLWFTDINQPRVLRYVNSAPRATTGQANVLAASAASLVAQVDPRGNATQAVFDYGTTTAYGATTGPVNLGEGAGPVDVSAGVQGLSPSTTYHVRVRATNAEGQTIGADTTFTTPAGVVDNDGDSVSPPADCDDSNPGIRPGAPDKPGDGIDQDCSGKDAAFRVLAANPRFAWRFSPAFTALTRVTVESLGGGETIRMTCRGGGCSFKKKTFRKVKKGTRKLTRFFGLGRRLRPGTKVEIRVTKPDTIGRVATVTMRAGRDPKIVRRCLRPGKKKPTRC